MGKISQNSEIIQIQLEKKWRCREIHLGTFY